jgi:hypothetical protein
MELAVAILAPKSMRSCFIIPRSVLVRDRERVLQCRRAKAARYLPAKRNALSTTLETQSRVSVESEKMGRRERMRRMEVPGAVASRLADSDARAIMIQPIGIASFIRKEQ